MNIKAQGLFNAAKWIEKELGQAALRDVLRACSPAVRDRYTTAIVINWHPLEEFVEFLEVAERLLGRGDGKLAEQVGAAGARENLRGAMVRAAVKPFEARRSPIVTQSHAPLSDSERLQVALWVDLGAPGRP